MKATQTTDIRAYVTNGAGKRELVVLSPAPGLPGHHMALVSVRFLNSGPVTLEGRAVTTSHRFLATNEAVCFVPSEAAYDAEARRLTAKGKPVTSPELVAALERVCPGLSECQDLL